MTSAKTSCVTVTSPSVSGCDLSRIAKRFVDPTQIASIGHEVGVSIDWCIIELITRVASVHR